MTPGPPEEAWMCVSSMCHLALGVMIVVDLPIIGTRTMPGGARVVTLGFAFVAGRDTPAQYALATTSSVSSVRSSLATVTSESVTVAKVWPITRTIR